MLIPIRHENMSARRWPIITLALIALNTVVFLGTHWTMEEEAPQLGQTKAHILMLAAAHPELKVTPEAQQLIDAFQQNNPVEWQHIQSPTHDVIDAWDARMRMMEDQAQLQAEMDSLTTEYARLSTSSIDEQYAFVPAHPKPIAYLTANFLHGGWLHLIGNMWFLWLAGFVLEDVWGRPVYTVFYLLSGAAALQFYAWTNAGSIIPTLGASGAVAALMGAFLVRFPKMKIEMMWIFMFRRYRFSAPAYWLLPLWLLVEMFYGSLMGNMGGVAHWAHVGGFLFGALSALGLRYSGFEHKVNAAIEQKVGWTQSPEIEQANSMMEHGQLDDAMTLLNNHLTSKPDSVDGVRMLREIHFRRNETQAQQELTAKLCSLHLKAKEFEPAWQEYEEFMKLGGTQLPAPTWLDLCRMLEEQQNFDRALIEYENLAAAYPKERQSLMALMGAARLCAKRLGRPQDAIKFYEAANVSPIPHLDLDQTIQAGLREAKAMAAGTMAAGAGAS